MIRAFIAITLPKDIRDQIGEVIVSLRQRFPSIRWEDPAKVHLTIAFLGALPEWRLGEVKEALKNVTPNTLSFELAIGGLSYFYKKHADSIIFLDVQEATKTLQNLYKALKEILEEQRFFLPNRLSSHITIGRLKRNRFPHATKQILVDINKAEVPFVGKFTVTAVNLYESLYSQKINTTHYRLLHSFPLG